MDELTKKHCVPCEGGVPVLTPDQTSEFLEQTPDWSVIEDGKKIQRVMKFKTFPEAISFVDRVAILAEEEGHHPDFHINYSKVTLELWTHAIGGLSENDFIVASKIDLLLSSRAESRD